MSHSNNFVRFLTVALLIAFVSDVFAGGRNLIQGGRAKRAQGGGVRKTIGIITNRNQAGNINSVVKRVISQGSPTKAQKTQIKSLHKRMAARLPVVVDKGKEPISKISQIKKPNWNNGEGGNFGNIRFVKTMKICWCGWKLCPFTYKTNQVFLPK